MPDIRQQPEPGGPLFHTAGSGQQAAGSDTPPPLKDGPVKPCEKCGRPMMFVLNHQTGKTGPIDVSSTIYVVFAEQTHGQHTATTATTLLERLEKIVLTDGTEIPRSAIRGLAVSHFQTCPSSNFFSKGNHRRGK